MQLVLTFLDKSGTQEILDLTADALIFLNYVSHPASEYNEGFHIILAYNRSLNEGA